MNLTPHQCRAARALLDWTVDRLAERARVAKETIIEFETGRRVPQGRTLQAIQRTLEVSGIVFIPENGGGTAFGLGVALVQWAKARGLMNSWQMMTAERQVIGAEFISRLQVDLSPEASSSAATTLRRAWPPRKPQDGSEACAE